MCVWLRECQYHSDVTQFQHADISVPVQVMLMRSKGYGGAAEGHIHLVCLARRAFSAVMLKL